MDIKKTKRSITLHFRLESCKSEPIYMAYFGAKYQNVLDIYNQTRLNVLTICNQTLHVLSNTAARNSIWPYVYMVKVVGDMASKLRHINSVLFFIPIWSTY